MKRLSPERDPVKALRLDGRTALVTGAGRGLGQSAARALAAAGAEVHAVSRTPGDLEAVAESIRSSGGRCTPHVCDVTKGDNLRQLFRDLPGLDVLVNNAGANIPEPFTEVSEEHLDYLLTLNVRSAFLVSQAAVRKMREDPDRRQKGGSVIHMSSQMGRVGSPNRTVYCMTKHALEGLTKAMAVELAPENIRVNAIAPTFIETPLTAPFFEDEKFRAWVTDRIPLGRVGTMEEVSSAVVFLASSGASLITGASLAVDGGWTAQ